MKIPVSVALSTGIVLGWCARGIVPILRLQEALDAKQFEVDILRRRLMTGPPPR